MYRGEDLRGPLSKGKMAVFSHLYMVILPFLAICTVPLAIFASITTILAFAILIFRVTLVYIEMGAVVIPHWLFSQTPSRPSTPPPMPSFRTSLSTSNFQLTTVRRRSKRRSSVSSHGSNGSTTPTPLQPTASDIGLNQSIGAQRDYEGVGGWRLSNPSDEEDDLWTKTNSRLELPAETAPLRRHHKRSLTSSGVAHERVWRRQHDMGYSPEASTMSPNTSRARTPPTMMSTAFTNQDGYFGPVISTKSAKKAPSSMTGSTGNSGSSKGSLLSMKQRGS